MTIKIVLNFVVIIFLALHMGDTVAGNKARRTRRLSTNGNQNATNKFKKGEKRARIPHTRTAPFTCSHFLNTTFFANLFVDRGLAAGR